MASAVAVPDGPALSFDQVVPEEVSDFTWESGEGLEQRERAPRRAREDPGEVADAQEGASGEEEKDGEKEEPLRALYFVRIAKAEFDDSGAQRLQEEFDLHDASVRLLTETLKMKRREKSEAKSNTLQARAGFRAAQALVRAKFEELQPLRDVTRKNTEAKRGLKQKGAGLECYSEEDLDQKIREIEYRQQHETVSLREEKELIDKLKRLNGQRAKIREYATQQAQVSSTLDSSQDVRETLRQRDQELDVLKAEEKACKEVYQNLEAVEKVVDDALDDLSAEWKAAIDVKNSLREKLQSARKARRDRNSEFWDNRDFSKKVRALVQEGNVDEAKALCEEQTEEYMAKINGDAEYRKKYLKLWETQRKVVSVLFDNADDPVDANIVPKTRKAAPGSILDIAVKPGQTKAEAIIERVLAGKGTEPARETSDSGVVGDSPAAEPVAAPAKKVEAKSKPAPALKSKPVVQKKVVVPDADFVLPEAALRKVEVPKVELSAEEKAKRLQEEKKRKMRRKELAEKRRQKAIERNKTAKEDEERKAATQRVVTPTPPPAPVADLEKETEEASPAQQVEAKPAPAKRTAAASKKPKAVIKPRSLPMPVRRNKKSKWEKIWSEYQAIILLLVVLLLIALLAVFFS